MDNVFKTIFSKCESLLSFINPFSNDFIDNAGKEKPVFEAVKPQYLDSISKDDAIFLVVYSASQESYLIDLKKDFEKWDHGDIQLVDILQYLLQQGVVLFTERDGDDFKNFSLEKSLNLLSIWEQFGSWNTIVYLTEKGEELWESDDWGLTIERANQLIDLSKKSLLPE